MTNMGHCLMVIDTSAIIAIIYSEKESEAMLGALEISSNTLSISTATYLEAFTVMQGRHGDEGAQKLHILLRELNVKIVPFDEMLMAATFDAYSCYRKGKRGLNFGDCFSYALAKVRNEPLLCKGDDFKNTDIELVAY